MTRCGKPIWHQRRSVRRFIAVLRTPEFLEKAVDGNKRTAFAVMDMFLRVNGYRLTLTKELVL
jgi:hypothetical protein